jgi:CelD/BcsL family acetyltransferase involved in cellulose biosynthesis
LKHYKNKTESNYEIIVANDVDGLMRLKNEWEQIADVKLVEPWQSFSWVESAAVSYSQEHSLRIITVRKNGRLTAIAPLVLKPSEQALKPMQYHILAGEEMKEPNKFVACDEESMKILIKAIAQEPVYPVRLSRIQCEQTMKEKLQKHFRESGWITRVMPMPCPYIELKGEVIKKSLKRDLKRARKKAKTYGELKYEIVKDGNTTDMNKSLQKGFMIEASGWKGQNNTAILSNKNRKKFFERYAESALREGVLRLSFLHIGDTPVAFHFAVETNGSYWLLNIGYDEKFSDCSPGNILLEESIQDAIKRGVTRYNLLGKEEPWTRRWTEKTHECNVFVAYRPNLCGMRSMMSDAIFLIKKLKADREIKIMKAARRKIKNNSN